MDNSNAKTTNKQAQSNCALETTVNNRSLTPNKKQATRFLEVLGFDPNGNLPLRKFAGKPASKFPNANPGNLAKLPDNQTPDCGIYLTINGNYGKHKKADIYQCRAIFCEHDDLAIEDQVFLWQQKGLPEPTLQVKTRHSVHSYWVLEQSIPVADWETLQLDLIAHMDSDTAIKDSSRVMRLPGYHHVQHGLEPKLCEIIRDSGNYYSLDDLRTAIPERKNPAPLKELGTNPQQDIFNASTKQPNDWAYFYFQEVEPKLDPKTIFDWQGHNWSYDKPDKLKGCCPNHETTSGDPFHCELKSDSNYKGEHWVWECPSYECKAGGDALAYEAWVKSSGARTQLTKQEFIDHIKKKASLAGISIPKHLEKGYKENSQNQSKTTQSRSQEDSFEKIPEWNQGDIAEWLAERYRGENNQQNQNGLAWFMDIKRWHCYGSEVQGIWSEIEPEACRNTITAELKNLRQKFAEYIAKVDSRVEELQEKYSNCEDQEESEPINNEMKRLAKKVEGLKKKLQSMVYSNNFVRGIEELLKSELGCKSWETPKDKIPFLNGVLDLTTMELKGHAPGNYLTWCLPYNYDPQAHCEPIKEWLLEMLRGDKNLMHLLRAYLNAVILGKTELQSFIELLGTGGTGKSTFIRLAMALVGTENVHTTTLSALEHSRFETASIWGKRLVIISDSERYTGSVTTLKALTGQDQIRYERKFGQPSGGFQPEAMVIIASNESIQSSEYTSAMQRRRITVPMNKKIKKSQYRNLLEVSKDGNKGEFADYIPGLFNWVLQLSDEEVKETILSEAHNSSELQRAKAENLIQTNPIADWLDRYLVYRRDAKTKVGTAKKDKDNGTQTQYQNTHAWLYASYCEYCAGTQSRPIGLNRFVSLLDDLCNNQLGLKVSKSKTRTGNYFFGLRFRSEADDDDFLITPSETPEEQISLNLDTTPINSTSRCYEPAPEGEASHEAVKRCEESCEGFVKGIVKTSTPALKDCEGCEDPTQIIKRTGERRVEVESSLEVEKDNNSIKEKIGDESSHSSRQSPETAHTENQSDTQNPSPSLHRPFTKSSQTLHHQEQPQEGAGDNQASGEAFSEGDRVTHSSRADEGRVFIVSGLKEAVDGDCPYYVLAFEEGCETAVNCQFNPSKLKKLSSN